MLDAVLLAVVASHRQRPATGPPPSFSRTLRVVGVSTNHDVVDLRHSLPAIFPPLDSLLVRRYKDDMSAPVVSVRDRGRRDDVPAKV